MTNIGEKIIHNWTEYQLGRNNVDITSLSEKCNPSAWDYLIVSDSEDGWANKKVSYWNIAIWAMEVNAYGTWADWSPTIQWDNVFLEAKEWNFDNLIIPAWTTLRFCWDWVPVLKVRNCFCNMGTISTYGPYITKDAYAYYMIGWTLKTIKNTPASIAPEPFEDFTCVWWTGWGGKATGGKWWDAWEDWTKGCDAMWNCCCYHHTCWWAGWAWTECAWWWWWWGWGSDEYKSWCDTPWCPWCPATWMNGWAWGKWGNWQKGWAWWWGWGWFGYCSWGDWWEGWFDWHYWGWWCGWNWGNWYLGNGWNWGNGWNSACYYSNCYWHWGKWGNWWDSFYGNGWRGWNGWCPGWGWGNGWNSVCWCWWDGWNTWNTHAYVWYDWAWNWWKWYLKWGNGWCAVSSWWAQAWGNWWDSIVGNGWNGWSASPAVECRATPQPNGNGWNSLYGNGWNWANAVTWSRCWNRYEPWCPGWCWWYSIYWTWGNGWNWANGWYGASIAQAWANWRNWWNGWYWATGSWTTAAWCHAWDSPGGKWWDAWWGMYWLGIFVWWNWVNNCIDAHWGNGWNGWNTPSTYCPGGVGWNATSGWVVHILYWWTFTEWCVDVSWGKGWCGWLGANSCRADNWCDWYPWDKFISKVYF